MPVVPPGAQRGDPRLFRPRTSSGWNLDPRIRDAVDEILRRYPVKISSGRRSPDENRRVGGAPNSDHLNGLGVDFVPDFDRGGTWNDVDRLARWAEPSQNHPITGLRWVGYTGDAGHGRGDHLHISFQPAKGQGGSVFSDVLGFIGRTALPQPRQPDQPAIPGLQVPDEFKDATTKAAEATAKAFFGLIVDVVGENGARALMYVLLVGAGTTLAVAGLARATGLGALARHAGPLAVARGGPR